MKERTEERARLRKVRKARHDRARYFRKTYGIGEAEFDALRASHGGLCYLCSKPMERTTVHKNGAVIDHCHASKRVRGLAHSHCNLIIGYAKDDPTLLRTIAAALTFASRRCAP